MRSFRYGMLVSLIPLSLLNVIASHAAAPCEQGSPAAVLRLQMGNLPTCELYFNGLFPVYTVQVWAYAVPFRKVQFTLPNPPWGTVLAETWLYPSVGDRINGLELDLGDCHAPQGFGVQLGSLTILATPGPCTVWRVGNECSIEDCEGRTRPGRALVNVVHGPANDCGQLCRNAECALWLPAYDLLPPDGATGVQVDATLQWNGTLFENSGGNTCFVLISTDPTCGTGQSIEVDCSANSFAPDFLQPGNTYYWRVRRSHTFDECAGDRDTPIQSFTTEGPLATTTTTWGRVKAMYRD